MFQAPDLTLARRRLMVGADLEKIRCWMDPVMLAWLETAVPQPPKEPDPQSTLPPVELPDDLTRVALTLREWPQREVPEGLGRRSREELQTMIDTLPGSRIPQALYLRSVLLKVPGPWTPPQDAAAPGESGLDPDDLPLVLEDMGNLLREWTGHAYAGSSTALLAEILAGAGKQISDLGKGKTRWFGPFIADPGARRFLGINEHDGTTWLNREALDTLLTAMVVCGLTDPTGPPRPVSLLDGKAIISEAAAKAGYDLAKLMHLLKGK